MLCAHLGNICLGSSKFVDTEGSFFPRWETFSCWALLSALPPDTHPWWRRPERPPLLCDIHKDGRLEGRRRGDPTTENNFPLCGRVSHSVESGFPPSEMICYRSPRFAWPCHLNPKQCSWASSVSTNHTKFLFLDLCYWGLIIPLIGPSDVLKDQSIVSMCSLWKISWLFWCGAGLWTTASVHLLTLLAFSTALSEFLEGFWFDSFLVSLPWSCCRPKTRRHKSYYKAARFRPSCARSNVHLMSRRCLKWWDRNQVTLWLTSFGFLLLQHSTITILWFTNDTTRSDLFSRDVAWWTLDLWQTYRLEHWQIDQPSERWNIQSSHDLMLERFEDSSKCLVSMYRSARAQPDFVSQSVRLPCQTQTVPVAEVVHCFQSSIKQAVEPLRHLETDRLKGRETEGLRD